MPPSSAHSYAPPLQSYNQQPGFQNHHMQNYVPTPQFNKEGQLLNPSVQASNSSPLRNNHSNNYGQPSH